MAALKNFTFIRHGALPEAFADCFAGRRDVPLSPEGEKEAAALGNYLASRRFDRIDCGTLRRVVDTRCLAGRRAPFLTDAVSDTRLDELDFGDWSLRPFAELRQACPAEFAAWNLGNAAFQFPNGERIGDFIRRTRAFLAELQTGSAETVAVFSHGGVIMSLLADLVGLPRSQAFSLWVPRGGLAELRIRADGGGQLLKLVRPAEFLA